jgi:hypothetical protein
MTGLAMLWVMGVAHAGACDGFLARIGVAKGDDLVNAWSGLAGCNADQAAEAFPRFLLASGDYGTLKKLLLKGMEREAYRAVADAVQQVPIDVRSAVVEEIGGACGDKASVVKFFTVAYGSARAASFNAWQPALEACKAAPFSAWLHETIAAPPRGDFQEKYAVLLHVLARTERADGLPVLEAAAITAAGSEGPLGAILEAMQRATQLPGIGARQDPALRDTIGASLVRVAEAAPPGAVSRVAERLVNLGREDLAAALLPRLYPDRATPSGGFRWAAAAAEICEDDVVLHYTSWVEAPIRWSVMQGATTALQGQNPKLKCGAVDWPVFATEAPVAAEDEVSDWLARLAERPELAGKSIKLKSEKVDVP